MRYADQYCTYQERSDNGKHVYIFTGECIVTHEKYSVTIPGEELHDYRKGHLIQVAMPSVSQQDREFLMSGISPQGWEVEFELSEGTQKEEKTMCVSEELMVVAEITLIKEGDEFYLEETGPYRERKSVTYDSKTDAVRAFELNTVVWEE